MVTKEPSEELANRESVDGFRLLETRVNWTDGHDIPPSTETSSSESEEGCTSRI